MLDSTQMCVCVYTNADVTGSCVVSVIDVLAKEMPSYNIFFTANILNLFIIILRAFFCAPFLRAFRAPFRAPLNGETHAYLGRLYIRLVQKPAEAGRTKSHRRDNKELYQILQ